MANKEKTREGDEAATIADRLQAIAEQVTELANRLRLADGTKIPKLSPAARYPIDPELLGKVRKMIETEPMRLAQIVEATGQTDNKIKAVITKMQRDGVKIVNLGMANKALWFIPNPKALARLDHAITDED